MPMNNDEMTQDERDYMAAFEADMGAADGEAPEVGGIVAEGGQSGGGAPSGGAVSVEAEAPAAEGQPTAGEPAPEQAAGDQAPGEPAAPAAGDVDIAKETQRLKSWEGRLRAMEAKLKSAAPAEEPGSEGGEQAASDALEKVAESASDPELGQAAEEMAEAVESGEMTAAQAMKQLAEDFGEDFVRMIEAVAVAKAREAGERIVGERVGELSKTVDQIIDNLVDDKSRAHFKAIAEKHPDFNDVGQSPEFKSYIESLPEAERAEAQRVASGGSSEEVIKLLDGYKASKTQAPSQEDTPSDEAMDAAEGVRSSGLVLPEVPEPAPDDYEGAWDKF